MTAAPLSGSRVAAPRFWADLRTRGKACALHTGAGSLSYGELADLVGGLADRLGTTRRLVLLEAANDVDTVVGLLACLQGGHPVLLAPRGATAALASLTDAYDPDVVLSAGTLSERRPGSRHDLHPDLAMLLSTSGSTGSPKLVRLSHDNLASNADAIASYLQIRPDDVAATALPLHYCYGLSVLTSHLARGAAVLLTARSVVEPEFWAELRDAGATTFPAVPYTFELLERAGFREMDLPSLRYVTQAGGRLDPELVRRYAELGQRRGWDLFVMYGATEATARMAYLPPELAAEHPGTIGRAIPGGRFRLDPLPADLLPDAAPGEVGELVYSGDNVMLGYAESPADLARGREVEELRTGDVARRTPAGLYKIVGRLSRFAKVFGLRIDLARVEQVLAGAGVMAACADGGERVVVAVDSAAAPVDARAVRSLVIERAGVPAAAVQVLVAPDLPRLASGKPDYPAIVRLAAADAGQAATTRGSTHHDARVDAPRRAARRTTRRGSTRHDARLDAPRGAGRPTTTRGSTHHDARLGERLRGEYAEVLGRPVTEDDSFVSLKGDSLSYVEMSLRIEQVLGRLPSGWHTRTVAELAEEAADAPSRRRWWPRWLGPTRTVETNVLLRALAIVMIVGSHSNLFVFLGGAHVLLAVCGFNFGRFHLTEAPRRERVRHLAKSIGRVVVPSVLWLSFAAAVSWKYTVLNVLLVNGLFGTRGWSEAWHYWFVEALVYTLLCLAAFVAIPLVDRVERRWSFWLPFVLALLFLLTRYDVVRLLGGDRIHRAHVVFWLFALGWAAVKATGWQHRALVSAVVVATVPGFFDGQVARETAIVVGVLLLTWVPAVTLPAVVARVTGVLAGASLYIYLCHWQIYPSLENHTPPMATLLSLSAGVCLWLVASRTGRYVERHLPEIRETVRWFPSRRYAACDTTRARATGPGGAPEPARS